MSCTRAEHTDPPEERTSGFHTSYEIWKLLRRSGRQASIPRMRYGSSLRDALERERARKLHLQASAKDGVVHDKSISLTVKPSEKYLSLVKELYGKTYVGDNAGDNVLSQNMVENRRQEILSILFGKPHISASELALILNTSARTIERDLEWLKKNGLVVREGADHGGKWIVLKQ